MSRYSRDIEARGSRGGRFDSGAGGRSGGRGGEASARGGGGRSGYDRGFADVRGRSPQGASNREQERGRDAYWYPNPNRRPTEGFGDFSSRGRFGGYRGASDLRPMMAGYDAEMRRGPGRGR